MKTCSDYPPPLNVAIRLAENSKYKHRHGATLVKHGRIVGKGINSLRHHKYSRFYQYECSCHAETAAILSYGGNVRGCTIYVARINNRSVVRNSMPCSDCFTLLTNLGISKVVYTTNEGFTTNRITNGNLT